LTKLIEETYGYSAQWLLKGVGDKFLDSNVSASNAAILKKIQKMPDSEINATLAFVKTLESVNKDFVED